MLFFRMPDGSISKIPTVAEIPIEELDEINQKIADLKKSYRLAGSSRADLKQEPDIRRSAAVCNDCNLCMVCAGNHRKYESWPPGQDQCFVNMIKSGKPIRDKPCEMCEVHDRELRDFKRSWMQGLSKESTLKNSMNSFVAQRRNLYKKYEIKVEIATE